MKRGANIVGSLVAILLLAAPSVWARCDAATMAAPCEMTSMRGMETAMPMASPCHSGERLADDCCDLKPAPEPVPTRLGEAGQLLVAGELCDPKLATSTQLEPTIRSAPPRSAQLHDLGRYTLFSAFLL